MVPIREIPLTAGKPAQWSNGTEHYAVHLTYDMAGILEKWPEAMPIVAFERADGLKYAHAWAALGSVLHIPLLRADTEINGTCKCMVSMLDGENSANTMVFYGVVTRGIDTMNEPPTDPDLGVIEQVGQAVIRAEQEVENAKEQVQLAAQEVENAKEQVERAAREADRAEQAIDGGYYYPDVAEDGTISWEGSKERMPDVPTANIKGPKGDDRVHVGTDNPPDGAEVWIVPTGNTEDDDETTPAILRILMDGRWVDVPMLEKGADWNYILNKPTINDLEGTLGVNKGGTGATTAAEARNNLAITPENIGAAKAQHDHTLNNLSGTLSIEKGGTGATDAETARNNLKITPENIGAAKEVHTHTLDSLGAAAQSRGETVTVAASAWTGDEAPFTATVASTLATAGNHLIVGVGGTVTAEQQESMAKAMIICTGQADGSITLSAFGDKPEIALPINIICVG